MTNEEMGFIAAIGESGITPPDSIIADGKIHRFSSNGQTRDDSGWYVLHLDGIAAGSFGCWRSGFTKSWCAKSAIKMTQAEREKHQRRKAAMRTQREAYEAECHRQGRDTAEVIWASSFPARNHKYLTVKGIQSHGARSDGVNLVIPMRDSAEVLHSLQTISTDGIKRFHINGRVTGCYCALGKPEGVLIVCEGFATGASIRESTGQAVAVAFTAGNLLPVAEALHAKYPALRIVIAADDDFLTPSNPGLTRARAAAQAVDGLVAVPDFGGDRPDKATDFNDLHQIAGTLAVKRCIDAAAVWEAPCPDEWPEPVPIVNELPAAPELDVSLMLPKVLADFVLDESDRMPCSPDYILATLLVCLGSVIGAKCGVKPKRRDSWIVVPNLWGGIVGDPSSKKSPAMSVVTHYLDLLEAREAEKLLDAEKIYEAEKSAYEAHQAAVKASMKKAAGAAKPDHLKMAASIADMQGLQAPEEPHALRYKSNDSSVEKLGDILSKNPQGIIVLRDELTGLFASWDRSGHEGDRAFFLESWNGTGSFNIDRIGRGEQFVKTLCLSVFGGIQPDKMELYLASMTSNLDNDGRVQRFQVMVYPNAVLWAWCDRHPVKGAREAVRDVFERLAIFDPVQDGAAPADEFVKLPHFSFDDEAQEVFIEWSTQLNQILIPNEQDPLMQQHLGKFEKMFCSLALVLHLAEGNIGPIKVASALRAAALCEYFAGHARRIYALVEGAKMTAAKTLLRRIKAGKLKSGFTLRELQRKCWAGLAMPLQAESALSILEEHHYIRPCETVQLLGRQTTRYEINPALFRGTS